MAHFEVTATHLVEVITLIEADSLEEATKKAWDLYPHDFDYSEELCDSLEVVDVEEIRNP